MKRPHETGRVELCINDTDQLSVQKLKDKVSDKLGISMKEFREFSLYKIYLPNNFL